MSLNRELRKLKEENLKHIPEDISNVLLKDVEIQMKKGVTRNALKLGDKIPMFELGNAVGRDIRSDELLENGPLIISFYRGAWCPYCNIELAAYQEALEEISEVGGQLIAISPELPDQSLTLIDRHALKYEILSDLNNEVAKQFGLVYKLEDSIKSVYKKLGVDIAAGQGNKNFEMPFAATYVINSDGRIVEASVQYDYTTRLDPEDAIDALKSCNY